MIEYTRNGICACSECVKFCEQIARGIIDIPYEDMPLEVAEIVRAIRKDLKRKKKLKIKGNGFGI